MPDSRISTYRMIALGCALLLLLIGRAWAYGAAVIVLVMGGFGFYFLSLAERLQKAAPPDERQGQTFARSIWWLLVLGFLSSLEALIFVR